MGFPTKGGLVSTFQLIDSVFRTFMSIVICVYGKFTIARPRKFTLKNIGARPKGGSRFD